MGAKTVVVRNEYWKYITPDGVTYSLTVGKDRVVLTDEGTGMPSFDYISQRSIHQHGETLVDFYLLPRIVQLVIRHDYCSREAYWNGRAGILNALRPNRGIPTTMGILQKVLPTGSKRNLRVAILEGPKFEPRRLDGWDEWAFTETLRFIAYDPVWYNPVSHVISKILTADCELVFPATFPIVFGVCQASETINYLGTWDEFPYICITGPVSSFTIFNDTTGEHISLAYDILADRAVSIYLDYGNKHVLLDDGTDLMGYVYGDLSTFHLIPGNNMIRIEGANTTAATKVDVTYYDRYIGI